MSDPIGLRKALYDVVQNQLRDRNPPETKETYDRLRSQGRSHDEAFGLLASVVLFEMNAILHDQTPFDHDRYVSALRNLPELPGGTVPGGTGSFSPGPHQRADRSLRESGKDY